MQCKCIPRDHLHNNTDSAELNSSVKLLLILFLNTALQCLLFYPFLSIVTHESTKNNTEVEILPSMGAKQQERTQTINCNISIAH